MSYNPKIEIKYRIECRTSLGVRASEFDDTGDAHLESVAYDLVKEYVASEISIYIENLPRVVAEIREALRLRKEEEDDR
ncbi:MAG TPA: hypothetical protein VGG45_16355 [Terracidiphilus sp.]